MVLSSFFELQSGATPGKKAMGILVVHDDGTPVSWSSSLIRNLLRAADFPPFLYGFWLLSMLASRDFKRLGDLAAGTLMIYQESQGERRELPDIAPEHPPGNLTGDEQRALLVLLNAVVCCQQTEVPNWRVFLAE
uniref:RDD family protein n=2 Tax=Candidatus Vondammii sp. HM_W22 TaxID=2687299 RepID=UPI002E7C4A69|nr:RDD family protein [Candidatus Vondammii sp. HM_W22]